MSTEPDRSEALYTELATTRITRATSAMVDTYAAREDRKRAHMLRVLIAEAVAARQRAEMAAGPSIEEMIEASSLGTPGAKAVRESVPIEQPREVVSRAAALGPGHKFKPRTTNPLRCDACGLPAGQHR